MKINKEELAASLAKDISRMLLPKIKRVVREEVDYTFSKLLREYNNGSKNINSVVDFKDDKGGRVDANQIVAERKREVREATQKRLEEYYKQNSDDPYAEFIATAEDPEEDAKIQEQIQMSRPKKKLSEASQEDLADPMALDFSEVVDRI